MEKLDVLLGLQWGDEGKGKVVDVLTPAYDIVARFQGGPNAGHTLEFNGQKHVLRSIPSGVFQPDTINVIGNGVVLDPLLLTSEAAELEKAGVDVGKVLRISRKAHLIMPTHRLLDAANEAAKGSARIGTTGKGIGPAYTDKVSRNGLRVGDLELDFENRYNAARNRHLLQLKQMGFEIPADFEATEQLWLQAAKSLERFLLTDTDWLINDALRQGKKVLAEGAQGTMLDVDFGSYPFVTSSNTVTAGACVGLGVAPRNIGDVYGIFKAYCTRVGAGPFPTELFSADGKTMRDRGHEYGAVTGRERRCGWIDLVALRHAIQINGVTKLIMMKSDVLDTFPIIRACVAYDIDGQGRTDRFPYDAAAVNIKPVYEDIPGWQTDLTQAKSAEDFPENFCNYISYLEEKLEVPIAIVSVGPDRLQTIRLK